MSSANRPDVLVIGAGPVGLTLACELLRHGVPVRLVEKKTGPNEQPNAAVVHVRTLEILCAMGAVEGFLREGYPLGGMSAHAFGHRIGLLNIGAGVESPFPQPRTLGQQVTERLLAEHFERLGGQIERGVEAVAVQQDDDEVKVTLRHLEEGNRDETATAAWVIGCEGSKSITREAAAIPFEGKRYEGKEFLQIEANLRWSYPHGFGYLFLTPKNIVLFFPYDDRGFYRIICAHNDSNPENHDPPTMAEIEAVVRATVDPSAELYDQRWVNRFRSGYRIAAHFRAGRLLLAGDSGHVHVPIGGQGMNFGIHDAFNLGWKLAAVVKGEAPLNLLDTYQAERHPADAALVRFTDRAFHILIGHTLATGRALRVLGPAVFASAAFQRRVRDSLGEMKVAYPASALNEDHGGSAGPCAGERAPDAVIVRMPERKTAHLFDLLHGPRWTLFLFAGLNPQTSDIETLERLSAPLTAAYGARIAAYLLLAGDPPVPVHENWAVHLVMDRDQYAHAKYGVGSAPCLYLIRPDWYVGFRGALDQHPQLTRYLKRILT